MFLGSLQNQINTLEILIEDDKQKSIQIEILKHEKVQLISELAAKESLIYGLRTERKVWGHELAQQGKTLRLSEGKQPVFLNQQIRVSERKVRTGAALGPPGEVVATVMRRDRPEGAAPHQPRGGGSAARGRLPPGGTRVLSEAHAFASLQPEEVLRTVPSRAPIASPCGERHPGLVCRWGRSPRRPWGNPE